MFISTEYGTEKGEEKHRGRKEKLRLADTVACCCLNCVRTKELKETLHSPFPKLFFSMAKKEKCVNFKASSDHCCKGLSSPSHVPGLWKSSHRSNGWHPKLKHSRSQPCTSVLSQKTSLVWTKHLPQDCNNWVMALPATVAKGCTPLKSGQKNKNLILRLTEKAPIPALVLKGI